MLRPRGGDRIAVRPCPRLLGRHAQRRAHADALFAQARIRGSEREKADTPYPARGAGDKQKRLAPAAPSFELLEAACRGQALFVCVRVWVGVRVGVWVCGCVGCR